MLTDRRTSSIHKPELLCNPAKNKQETAEDGMAGLQSKFQNFNAKVNQNVDRQTDIINP